MPLAAEAIAPAAPKPSAPLAPKPSAAPPSPPPKPATTPEPRTEPRTPDDDNEDPFAELDRKAFAKPEKVEVTEPDKKPDAPAATEPEKKMAVPKALREELDRAKTELKTKNDAVSKMETRIAELEAKGADTTKLTERLASLERERDEARAEASAAKAEVSDEFKAKWDKPFDQAAEHAKSVIEKLAVGQMVDDPDTGQKKWQAARKASWDQDFAGLYHLAKEDPAGAIEKAEAMFGKAASLVLNSINELDRLDRSRSVALMEEKANWKEKSAAKEAERVRGEEGFRLAVTKTRESLISKYPDIYGESPDDPEGNEILADGRRLATERPKTFQQAVVLAARNRLHAEVAPRLVHRIRKLTAELETVKAENEGYKKSRPGPGSRPSSGGGEPSKDDANPLDELDEIFKK